MRSPTITEQLDEATQIFLKNQNISHDQWLEAAVQIGRVLAKIRAESHPSDKSAEQKKPKKPKATLPNLPEHLAWPTEKFSEAAEGVDIIQFLESTSWPELIKEGYGQLRFLRLVDESAVAGIKSYEQINYKTKKRKRMPANLHFARENEATDRRIICGDLLTDPKLPGTVASRLARKRAKTLHT